MKKCWLFEETDKKMIPMKDEWALAGNPPEPVRFDYLGWKESTILKLTEFSSNPFEPIKEVAELAETALTAIELLSLETRKWDEYKDLYKLAKAISECMKRMGEK